MKKWTLPVTRLIDGSVSVEAKTKNDAIKIVEKGLADGSIDVPDDSQYYYDWEIREDNNSTEDLCAKFNQALGKAKYICENKNFEIKHIYNFEKGRYDSIWNGGECLTIENKDIVITVNAYGDVIAELTHSTGTAYVKDKNNAGYFTNEFGSYIKDDNDYYSKLNDGSLILDNNNWWEAQILRKKDKVWIDDDSGLLDDSTITEVLDNIDSLLEWAEECYRDSLKKDD